MKSMPIDTSVFEWRCIEAPALKVDTRTGEVRKDRSTGKDLYTVQLLVKRPGDNSIIVVTVADEMAGVLDGLPVRVAGLVASMWEIDGRAGVAFRADAVLPVEIPGGGGPAGGGPGRRAALGSVSAPSGGGEGS